MSLEELEAALSGEDDAALEASLLDSGARVILSENMSDETPQLPLLFSEMAGMQLAAVCRNANGTQADLQNLVLMVNEEVQRLWNQAPLHPIEIRSYDVFISARQVPIELRFGVLLLDEGEGFRGLVFDPREQMHAIQALFHGYAFVGANETKH